MEDIYKIVEILKNGKKYILSEQGCGCCQTDMELDEISNKEEALKEYEEFLKEQLKLIKELKND